jgi:hypothetical protein
MSPDFKYFHWAIPKPDQPFYGLYDVFDNHLFLLSDDFEMVWKLKKLVKSKIILDIIDFSQQIDIVQNKIDNSVVEKWGLESTPYQLFRDLRSLSDEFQNKDSYKNHYLISNCNIIQNNVIMDDFKTDLQKQLFFFYYCLKQSTEYNSNELNKFMNTHLLLIAELSESFNDAKNKLLGFSFITHKKDAEFLLHFLRGEKLLYE